MVPLFSELLAGDVVCGDLELGFWFLGIEQAREWI